MNISTGKNSHGHTPYVSVIMPTYRRWDLLGDAINSLLRQTFSDWEVVVVNDAGGAAEGRLLELLDDTRIRYVEHSVNKGLASARNTGILNSRGVVIAYLDDDDLYHENHLAVLVDAITKNGWDVAYTDSIEGVYDFADGQYRLVQKKPAFGGDFNLDRLWRANLIPVNCMIHKRDCLDKTGLFDPTLRLLEDWDLWLRMSRYYDFHHVPEVTTEFRVRQNRTNMSTLASAEMWLETKCRIYRKYVDVPGGHGEKDMQPSLRRGFSRFVRHNFLHLYDIARRRNDDSTCLSPAELLRSLMFVDICKLAFRHPAKLASCLKL